MAPGADDAAILTFIGKWGGLVLGALATGVMTIIAWLGSRVVKKHDEEIASIKGGISTVQKDVTEMKQAYTPLARFEVMESRTRDSIIALHGKIEASEQRLAGKIDAGNSQIMGVLLRRGGGD